MTECLLDCSKAFGMVKHDKLFSKLIIKGLPAIVVQALVSINREQQGWTRLGGRVSEPFGQTNGTRQGPVLSQLLFSVYLDDLLRELRTKQLGCHVKGYWLGAFGGADNLILLAPS